jgi:ketosteroid isomerase-like protein
MEYRQLARLMYDAIERDDIDAFLEHVDPDVEFNSLITEAETRTFHGHEGVREWWARMMTSLGGVRFEIQGFEQVSDDWTLMRIRTSGTVSGVEIEQTMWQTTHLRGDIVLRWWVDRTEEEARETIRAGSKRPSPGSDTA